MKSRPGLLKKFKMALLGLSALILGCGRNDLAGGGDATETGNARVAGHIVLENGAEAVNAEVIILASDYNPIQDASLPDSQKVISDQNGSFYFKNVDSGTYNIQVKHSASHTSLLITNINVAGAKVRLEEAKLEKPGSISIPLPETSDSGIGYVFIPGTTLQVRVDSEIRAIGKITLDSVPSSLLSTIAYTKGSPSSRPIIVAEAITVNKGAVTMVPPFKDWLHSIKLKVDVGALGINLKQDLIAFPMLVRLNAPDFNFAEAQAGGEDIRFAKADGTPLVREIEAWDAKAGHAEIWVRMDSVHAGSTIQYLTLYWGNSKVKHPSYAFSVFDPANGFAGVWHLGEESPGKIADGIYKNATGLQDNGNDRVANTSKAGIIAGGQGFDSTDFVEVPNASSSLANPNAFTVSIWYRCDKITSILGGEMLSLGDNYGLRILPDGRLHLFFYPPIPPLNKVDPWWEVNFTRPENIDGNWHLVAGVFEGNSLSLYVDGVKAASDSVIGPVAFGFPLNVTMGKHGNGKKNFDYVGDLDEAEIHSVARSPEWMRLSYENQKPLAKFPEFVKP